MPQSYGISHKCAPEILKEGSKNCENVRVWGQQTDSFLFETPSGCFERVSNRREKAPAKFIAGALLFIVWSHLGLNQGLPDYESGALTN